MPHALRLRLFLSCWLIYALHFATDFVREHYLVVSIVEDHSYRLDKYYGLHVDIFRNPPEANVQGAHHGANPGISMVAAVPYFLLRPAVELVVRRELAARAGGSDSAAYRDERPRRVEFYQKVRRQGLDVRFGLVSAITTVFCMAPLTAASAVLMYTLLAAIGVGQRRALGLSFVYAFATPVFFRTAYLNQNLALGSFAFAAFALIWNPGLVRWSAGRRAFVAGLLGGLAFLCDYSGAILLGLLGVYAWWRTAEAEGTGIAGGFRNALCYAAGAVPGVLLLWHYQWSSFGNPFLPPQHWMAPVEWIDVGYRGVGGFSPELFKMLLLDPRFGLFLAMPLAALAIVAPWLARRGRSPIPVRESVFCILVSAALLVFFSTVQYTRLQWVTGIRYLAPLFPFLFLAAVPALLRLPRLLAYGLVLISLVINWSIAMVRDQGTILRNIQRVFVEGFQLPWLTVLGKMSAQYVPWLKGSASPLPLFALAAVLLGVIWMIRSPGQPLGTAE